MPDRTQKSLKAKLEANHTSQLYSVRDLHTLSLALMQIRQIKLLISLHVSYAPIRSCTSSDYFIFGITLLSLSLSNISFSRRSRSVQHWAVIKIVFLHPLIFIQVFNVSLAHLIMHYFVFWPFILKRLLTERIVELFLSGTRFTSDQPEKESTILLIGVPIQ